MTAPPIKADKQPDPTPEPVNPTEADPEDHGAFAATMSEDAPDVSEDLQNQITGLHGRIDEQDSKLDLILAAVADKSTDADAPVVKPVVDQSLPKGTTRFFCKTAGDFQIILKQKGYIALGNGHMEPVPQVLLSFNNHIATTDDDEKIDLARAYIEKKGTQSEFVEDRNAQPVSALQVVDGARSTPHRQPEPLSPADQYEKAAMAARI